MYLKSSGRVLKEKGDRSIVDVFTTSYLPWFDLGAGRQRRVVEHPHHCVAVTGSTTHLLVGFLKEQRILHTCILSYKLIRTNLATKINISVIYTRVAQAKLCPAKIFYTANNYYCHTYVQLESMSHNLHELVGKSQVLFIEPDHSRFKLWQLFIGVSL